MHLQKKKRDVKGLAHKENIGEDYQVDQELKDMLEIGREQNRDAKATTLQ